MGIEVATVEVVSLFAFYVTSFVDANFLYLKQRYLEKRKNFSPSSIIGTNSYNIAFRTFYLLVFPAQREP
jgi:hypothetical protein